MKAPDAAVRLTTLKEEGTWNRDNLIEEGGWVTFASMEEPVDGAADLCADQLVDMEAPAATTTSTSPTTSPGMTPTTTSSAEQASSYSWLLPQPATQETLRIARIVWVCVCRGWACVNDSLCTAPALQ